MFEDIEQTDYPPEKSILVWDGECSFCRYWVTRWQKMTKDLVQYMPYQLAASKFPDIEKRLFQQASRLIDPDGKVYSGPASAYHSVYLTGKYKFLDSWYSNSQIFKALSDHLYQFIAKNRSFMMKVTTVLWGSDPTNTKPFWVIYLGILLYLLYVVI